MSPGRNPSDGRKARWQNLKDRGTSKASCRVQIAARLIVLQPEVLREKESGRTPRAFGLPRKLLQTDGVADAQEFAVFGGWHARVCGDTIVVVEARFGRPGGQGSAAQFGDSSCEFGIDFASAGIARRNGTARAGIAALEGDIADFEAHGVIFIGTEQTILPKRGDAVDFQRGAKTFACFGDG